MVRKRQRSSTIYFHTSLKRPSYGYSGFNYSFSRALDTTVSVRSIVKYSVLVLVFLIVLGSVFLLGRVSAKPDPSGMSSAQLSGQTKQTAKQSADVENLSADKVVSDPDPSEDVEEVDADVPDNARVIITRPEPAVDKGEKPLAEETEVTETPDPVVGESCTYSHAPFDYNYTKVNFSVSNFNKDVRGDNWGTITSLKLTVTNNEKCTIINPTQLKIKLTAKGKGSLWWDDEVFLPETFKRITPGGTATDTITVHVSYSDIYGEKELKATLFDDYDIPMSTVKKYMFIE
jgi:hypothetical protein